MTIEEILAKLDTYDYSTWVLILIDVLVGYTNLIYQATVKK